MTPPTRHTDTTLAVLRLLSDGASHSGERLAARLGVSRAAVWKQVRHLRDLGLGVRALRGVGYRLDRPLELLDRTAIRKAVDDRTRAAIDRLDVVMELSSTNSFLLAGRRPPAGRLAVCLAEFQSGGRGRRGRTWLAPLGRGLCLSVAWTFAAQPDDLAALGLAAGIVARRALSRLTELPIRIKWPNDLLIGDRKLGGILVELSAESHGPCFVVIGIGINVAATPAIPKGPGAWAGGATDLATAAGREPPSRNALAAGLIDELAGMLRVYGANGFAEYRDEFADADYLYGREIEVDAPSGTLAGRALGIGPDGVLLLDVGDRVSTVIAGDVSVRPSA